MGRAKIWLDITAVSVPLTDRETYVQVRHTPGQYSTIDWVNNININNASKPVVNHFHLPNHSKQHIAIFGLSLHLGFSESRKTLEQKFIFQINTHNPHGINERFSLN